MCLCVCVCVCVTGGEGVKRLVLKPKLGFGLSVYKQILGLDVSIEQGYISYVFI
jgi:hypothetical protein